MIDVRTIKDCCYIGDRRNALCYVPAQDLATDMKRTLLWISLLWSLVEVHSQTAPYVSFMGENLLNHSYVDLTLVGEPVLNDGDHSVQCHTDLMTCCRSMDGQHRGDWYFPDETRLPFPGGGDIVEARGAQQVDLRRNNNANSPSGIYRCDIPTDSVNANNARETVYVGLYATGGDVTVSDTITHENTGSNEFTLTCISTGGPATTVTWTRDSVTVTEGTETVLVNLETAQYTHTLTGNTEHGLYTCTVNNSKPSVASASLNVQAASPPTNIMAIQEGAASISVSWSPPSPLGDTTGYSIDYTSSDGSSDSVTVSGGSTDNHLLTDLQNGDTYTISIVATSSSFPSESTMADMTVGLRPDQPVVTVTSRTATSITLSGGVPPGSVAESYEVTWQRDTSLECSDEDSGMAASVGEITGLEEDSRYSITVRAINDAGSSEVSVTAMTLEAAPSAAPSNVRVTGATSTTITVQWGMVPCIHRNGEITGYSVRYGEMGSESTQTMSVSEREVTIRDLTSSTNYSIEVAGVTGMNLIGTYSSAIPGQTIDGVLVMLVSTTVTTLTISWTLSGGVTATTYTISYSNTDCPSDTYDDIPDIAGSETMYTLTGLEEGTEYSITVTATLSGGGTREDSLTATTMTAAPSAAPSDVSVSPVNPTAITIQWGMVPCIHRNGEITGYSVQYGEMGSESTQTMSVSGSSSGGMATISGLSPATMYTVVVAAENSAGTGDYSDPVTVETPDNVYLSLNGDIIPNHGYVVISEIGSTDNTALLCITNRPAPSGGTSGGDWFAPDGDQVGGPGSDVPGFDRNRAPMIVRLRRNGGTPEEGIYHCEVEDADIITQTLYVGLYNSGGGIITISGDVTLTVDSDLNGLSPQFTLTCISTGGPATTVTWTRDSETAVGTQISAVVDGVTAQYNHTLTVTGRLPGVYICTVANDVSPQDSESFTVEVTSAPGSLMSMQENLTSIRVSWTPSSDATGYTISYTGGGSNDSVTVSGGSTDNYLLTGLVMEASYTISIIATSQQFPSDAVVVEITLIPAPGQPIVSAVTSITATSISLSWSVPSGSVVTSSEVMWREASSGTSEGTSGSLTDTSYTIHQLESNTDYNITVTVSNTAGSTDSHPIIISTNSDSCQIESSESTCSDTPAIIGGVVVAIVLILTTALTIIVIVLVLRSRRGDYSTRSKSEVAIIPEATNEGLELSKFSEATYADPDAVIQTSSNEAYGVTKTARARGGDAEYETVSAVPPSTSHSTQPPTDDYEPV